MGDPYPSLSTNKTILYKIIVIKAILNFFSINTCGQGIYFRCAIDFTSVKKLG